MALSITIQRGHTFDDQIPFTADDLNAAALPTATIEGAVGSGDIGPGSVGTQEIRPGPICFGFGSNIANAYSVALDPAATALVAGLWLSFKVSGTNTGAATLNVAGLGAKPLVKNLNVPLGAGDLRGGQTVWVQYDGASWQLLTPPGFPPLFFGVAAGTATALTLTLSEVEFTAYDDLTGRVLSFLVPIANTGGVTIDVNGKGSQPITKLGNSPLGSGDLVLGSVVNICWDGNRFQLVNAAAVAVSLPDVIAPGTTVFPASVTVDAKGRVTALTAGAAGATFTHGPVAVPASGSTITSPPHGLVVTPPWVRAVWVCNTAENGWAQFDEVDSTQVVDSGATVSNPVCVPFATPTVIGATVYTASGGVMPSKSAPGTLAPINFTRWSIKLVAKL